jgi:hypothetical protein
LRHSLPKPHANLAHLCRRQRTLLPHQVIYRFVHHGPIAADRRIGHTELGIDRREPQRRTASYQYDHRASRSHPPQRDRAALAHGGASAEQGPVEVRGHQPRHTQARIGWRHWRTRHIATVAERRTHAIARNTADSGPSEEPVR